MNRVAVLFVLLAAAASSAEEAKPESAAEPAPAPVDTPPAPAAAPSAPASPTVPPAPDPQLAELKTAVDTIARVRLSGFVQGRFEWHEDAAEGLNAQGKPAETTQFLVRRARLKAAAELPLCEAVVDVDALASRGVVLRDAGVTFIEPWTPLALRLTAGQFKVPFGYEILLSDDTAEMPERTLGIRRVFSGDRDRGLRLTGKWGWLRFIAALVNGNGVEDSIYVQFDQNLFKDLIARAGADLGWLAFNLSGYLGENLKTNKDLSTPAYQRFRRLRLGADAQARFALPLGPLSVRAEAFLAQDGHLGPGLTGGAPSPALDVLAWGAQIIAVQSLGEVLQIAFRLDHFEPDAGSANDQTFTGGATLIANVNTHLKMSLTYEVPWTEGVNPDDAAFTAQIQVRF
jgi:hypothetical protein